MQTLSSKQKKLIAPRGGINVYSFIELTMWLAKFFDENIKKLNETPEPEKNIDYKIYHDPNNFEPGYF